jgi:phosphatidate cytidylyltransferase
MVRRTGTALLLLALILPAIYFGGVLYYLIVAAFILTATWEYVHMFSIMQFKPSLAVSIGGVFIILAARHFASAAAGAALSVAVLVALTVHLIDYERGRDRAAIDFAITVGAIAYLGWVAAYMIDLRGLPNGGWWIMLVFPVVWLSDSGAYMIGVKYGRHKMLPRLSPHKSWEGYFAGVVGGAISGAFFAFAYTRFGPLHLSVWQGALLGLILGVLTTLGDVGESLFKRLAGVKDSGSLFPGHGGAFDRIDSLIWASVIGYFCVRFWLT